MIRPERLRENDTVALLAPSGPGDPALLAPSVKSLEDMGLRVRVMESCRSHHGYLAAVDAVRAHDINEAFADTSVKGIFAWRGGYGSQRLLSMLDYEMIRHNPKILAGYSDITALHTALTQRCGLVTFHAPMAASELCRGADPFTLQSFKRYILHHDAPLSAAVCNPPGVLLETVVPGRAEGLLIGGNLSLLASSLGTEFEIDTRDKILFIEEVNEEPYKIDRLLLQLKLAGKFRDCRGMLLGSFRPETLSSLAIAVTELIRPEGKPVLANLACGHCLPTLTLPFGAPAGMDATHTLFNIYL